MSYKLLTYRSEAGARAGMLVGVQVHDVAEATGNPAWSTTLAVLDDWDRAAGELAAAAARLAGKAGRPLAAVELLAPVPVPGDIYCAGANYRDHVNEMSRARGEPPGPTMKDLGEKPWFFIKSGRAAVVGPNTTVTLPAYARNIDWEIELAAVIGRKAKNMTLENALSCVAGYTICNDLSARDASRREKNPPASPFYMDWLSHKSFDGSCPMGPWITPASEIPDPHRLAMKLWVAGELMQDSNSAEMIFDTAEQIVMLTSRVTLYPGDVILTGTPAGVGNPRKRFLQPGETVKLWIEHIGEFSHQVTR